MSRQNRGPYLSDLPNAHGYFEICWTENGRSKRKSTGTGDRRAAQRFYAEFLLAVSGDEVTAGGVPRADQVIDAYLADKADVIAKDRQGNAFGHLKAHFGDLIVSEIDSDDVEAFLAARAAGQVSYKDAAGKVRGGRKAKPSTIRYELGMLSTAIGHCIRKKRFKAADGSPLLRAIHKPDIELPAAPTPRDRWLQRDEAAAFLAAAREHTPKSGEDPARLPRVYRYIAMMLHTAARKETVYALTWDRIVLQKDPKKVEQGDYGLINFQAPGRRITKKRRGWVPIGAELYPILIEAEKQRVSDFYLDSQVQPYHAFRDAAKRAGLVDADGKIIVSPHVLRHTFGTWAAQDGVDLWKIAGVMHDTIATVEKNYLHHTPDHLRSAVNRPIMKAA